MSQDHQPALEKSAPLSQDDVSPSDGVLRADSVPAEDPMQLLIQASQAAESLHSRFAELQTRQAEITGEQDQLKADRTAFEIRASEFAKQVARDRVEQRQIRAQLDDEAARVRKLAQSLEEGHTRLGKAGDDLEKERIQLRQTLSSELASDRDELRTQQEALRDERTALEQRQSELEESFEEQQSLAQRELEQERELLRERVREEFSSEFSQLHREQQEWNERCKLERDQLSDETESLQQQREMLGEQISNEQSRLRDELEKRRQKLLTEQTNLQRRYRFQFEHLARARNDFDEEVRQLRRDQQSFRTERHRFQEQHRMQLGQLSHIRTLLDEREASLRRELRFIERSRTASQMDIQRQQRQLQEHRDTINHELDERSRQVVLQEESISQSTQRLTEKTRQLSRLRSDLDTQQRDLLELRIILEDIRGDLQKQDSEADLSVRQQNARESLQSFFNELHQRIHDERQEVERQITQLEEDRAAFRVDRKQLEDWFEKNHDTLQPSAAAVTSEPSAEYLQLKDELDQLHTDRTEECVRSEKKIRSLLDELESLRRTGFARIPATEPHEDTQRPAA
ncbi:MAG: hypothetical protein MK102_09180 [Fuerstiella sp.]|nr:hypothetical protein [Fuerstiella sp.]